MSHMLCTGYFYKGGGGSPPPLKLFNYKGIFKNQILRLRNFQGGRGCKSFFFGGGVEEFSGGG